MSIIGQRSIFWDLPYWKHQLLWHKLDVMHIEKNFYENIINTVMDVPGKSKDNARTRLDIEELCVREELHLRTRENGNSYKSKAKFALSAQQRRSWCEWFCALSLPDGYCSNFNNKVDSSMTKLQNMNNHDYDVFMEAFLPIAFSALSDDVLEHLVALSEFFKNLCANILCEDLLMDMHSKIALILCKLETIFPPAFWNGASAGAFSIGSLLRCSMQQPQSTQQQPIQLNQPCTEHLPHSRPTHAQRTHS